MRTWLADAYRPESSRNPIHALERGECSGLEFERLLAAELLRVDGGAVVAEGLLRRMFAGKRARSRHVDEIIRALRGAASAPRCSPTPGDAMSTRVRTSPNCSTLW